VQLFLWKDGDRALERRLKSNKKAAQLCPVCKEARKLEGMSPEAMFPERLIGGDDSGQNSKETKKRCATAAGS
jgi:hypothetical protein